MKTCLVLLLVVLSLFPTSARADIPPEPPAGLKKDAGPRPLPIAVAGGAVALAVALGGIWLARSRGGNSVRGAALLAAVVVLTVAGVFAYGAFRAWEEHDALQAKYDKTLANWHPRGPVRPPRVFLEAPRALAVLAVAPQDSFPHSLPWAALVLNSLEKP